MNLSGWSQFVPLHRKVNRDPEILHGLFVQSHLSKKEQEKYELKINEIEKNDVKISQIFHFQ